MEDERGRRAKEYRRHATACLEVAERLSVVADRDLMMRMARCNGWSLLDKQ
jgi:hypothetical protein